MTVLTLHAEQKRSPGFDDKRLHLLKATAKVFADVGYDGASMRRIAAEAELSLSGIYHYVSGKEELLYLIQYHTFDSLVTSLERCLEGVSDPRERLATAIRNHIRHFGENMHELKVCARDLETLEDEAYEAVRERRHAYFQAVHQIVGELAPQGVSTHHSWIATANLFGMLNWFYQWYDAGRSKVSLDDLAAEQTALFLDGYLAKEKTS
jgi:AcrR family transcriptional regulator